MKVTQTGCIVFFFMAFNAIFWLMGCGLLSLGIFLSVNKGPYLPALAPGFQYLSASALVLISGILSILMGFFGCFGILRKSHCMMMTYFLIATMCLVLEIMTGVLGFTFRNELRGVITNELVYGIHTFYPQHNTQDDSGLRKTWDTIQTSLECCGVEKHSDWYYSNGWPGKRWVPDSCCLQTATYNGCGRSNTDIDWYTRGCLDEIIYWMAKHLYMMGIISVVIGVVQILCISASLALYFELKRARSERG